MHGRAAAILLVNCVSLRYAKSRPVEHEDILRMWGLEIGRRPSRCNPDVVA